MIGSLTAIGLAALVGVLAWATGGAAMRQAPTASRLERTVFTTALGIGILAYAVFALGISRLARPAPLWGGTLVVAAVCGAIGWRRRAGSASAVDPSPAPRALALACGAFVAAAGLLTLVGALAPPAGLEWDALSYHLAAPKAYLREGRIFYLPYDHHSNFPFTLNMLFLLMLSAGSVAGAKLMHWLCGALLVASVAAFAHRHLERGRAVGAVAAAILATTPIVVWEATTAYVDLATALFAWLSVYALVNAASEVEAGRAGRAGSVPWLVVSSVLMGLAIGTKMTCLAFWGMGMVGILLWNRVARGTWARETVPHAALWGALSLAIGSVWYVKTWLYTGNPVYPFFYSLFGGRYWNAQNAAQYAADQATFGLGKGVVQLLLGPWNVTHEAALITNERPWIFTEYVAYGLAPVYVAALLALPVVLPKPPRALTTVLLYGLGIFAFWFFLMQQTRYLVPALPAFALGVAVVLTSGGMPVRVAGGALAAAGALWGLLRGADIAGPAFPVATGAVTREAFLVRRLGPLASAQFWINGNAPADAKVALFDEVRGFYLDRPVAWAEPNHAAGLFGWEGYADAKAFTSDFRRRGYTYLLHNGANTPADAAVRGAGWRGLFQEAIETGLIEPVARFGPVNVFRIP